MVRILVLSFLFKGESFSFVRGLWLLHLDNRKTFIVDIFWISFASGVLRWWLKNLFLPSIWVFLVRSIFFCRGSSTCLDWMRLYQGVFISINEIYDFILLFFYSFCFFLMMQQIWYGWRLLCRREGALTSWRKTLDIELAQSFSNWFGQQDHHHQGIYKVIQVRSTG